MSTVLKGIKIKSSYQIGIKGEELVQQYYETLGFDIIAKRYKTKFGEIDLVVSNQKLVIFIEVKSRKEINANYELINKKQIARNCNAARIFLSDHQNFLGFDMRFDFALVVDGKVKEIIESAWLDEF